MSSSSSAKKSSIYTKTGDKGTSSLFNGERRRKDDQTFLSLGAVDELSAFIGVAREHSKKAQNHLDLQLEEIQSRLIDLMSSIATPQDASSQTKKNKTFFDPVNVEILEQWIDELDSKLPPLTLFILPSGGLASTFLHVCRSTCRRAERETIALIYDMAEGEEMGSVHPDVGKYLNRLSDYFFVAARHAAYFENETEVAYKKGVGGPAH